MSGVCAEDERADEPGSPLELAQRSLERRGGTALIIDVVSSVSLIEKDELATIAQWVEAMRHVQAKVLPAHSGRLVKSLGDGALCEFANAEDALRAAMDIMRASPLPIRIGIESGEFLTDQTDIYGRVVNRAARLMAIAEHGGIVLSERVRGEVSPAWDALIEDLGYQPAKNLPEPLRAFAISRSAFEAPALRNAAPDADIPVVAVLPFTAARADETIPCVGDVLCEEVIRQLGQVPYLRVISRLSSSRFRDARLPASALAGHLNAQFILGGRYSIGGGQFTLVLELVDAKRDIVVWSETCAARTIDIYSDPQSLLAGVSARLTGAILDREIGRVMAEPAGNLENYVLLLGAISLINSLSRDDFDLADRLLRELEQRDGRQELVHVWRALWLNMRIQQGWSMHVGADGTTARRHCQAALDINPRSAMALAIDGLIATTLGDDLSGGAMRLEQAIGLAPSNPLAWLFHSVNRLFADDGGHAVLSASRALVLAPFDPSKYLYDSIAASAAFVYGDFGEAERLSLLSLRGNRLHASTYRVRTAALWKLGRAEEAREAAAGLLALQPGLTVSGWLAHSPARHNRVGAEFAECLRAAGVPD